MQAVKQIVRPDEHGQVIIDLPAEFRPEQVEVIVLQHLSEPNQEITTADSTLTEEQKLLPAFPVATEEDLNSSKKKDDTLTNGSSLPRLDRAN